MDRTFPPDTAADRIQFAAQNADHLAEVRRDEALLSLTLSYREAVNRARELNSAIADLAGAVELQLSYDQGRMSAGLSYRNTRGDWVPVKCLPLKGHLHEYVKTTDSSMDAF